MTRFFLASLGLALSTAAHATPVNVGADAVDWAQLFETYNTPANNAYASPASVTWSYDAANPSATVAIATVRCGAFAAQAMQIGGGLTSADLSDLTGSTSPDAATWYDKIVADSTADTLRLYATSVSDLQRGDLLVAKYATAVDTGHVMTVASVRSTARGDTLNSIQASPAASSDHKWLVVVYDATKSPHGSTVGTSAAADGVVRDSRNRDLEADGSEDAGMGVGTVVVYTNASTGAITGWRWSYNGTYYSPTQRPMVVGRLTNEE